MAYLRNTLISRPGYSGVSGWTDTVGDILKGAVSVFGAQQRAQGGQEALLAQQQAAAAAQSGSGSDTVMLVAGVGLIGVAAFLLLRKKPAKAA